MLKIKSAIAIISLMIVSVSAKFGEAPAGWEDMRFGLVSNGSPTEPDSKRLKTAVEEMGIKIEYRYRYVNEGVDPAKNACVNLFRWEWDADYSKHSKRDAGVEASYVIYVLQEEGGRIKLLQNMADPDKMQKFFHTLQTVAEHANSFGATIIVEPDTWGYLLQDRFGTTENTSIEVDPLKIPAVVNNIKDTVVQDSFYVIPDPTKPWEKVKASKDKPIQFGYLSDLPNNMAGFGRAIIRTMHKFAPDCYVGFLASHWSVNLNLGGKGWSSNGMVWATPELIDTSAKINIEFFKKFYYGSIDEAHPWKPGDSPDFIGVEKNGWCAGTWEKSDGRMYWYWGVQEMKNYLKWVKQIAHGLDLPVVGWQISIGNMNNPNTADGTNMANAYKDTFFPYFFTHVKEFTDAGFIGFLVGKGLQQATDFTLPGETVGEKGWFFSQLKEFDKGRPWLDTTIVSIVEKTPQSSKSGRLFISQTTAGLNLSLSNSYAEGAATTIKISNLRGQMVSRVSTAYSENIFTPTSMLARGTYLLEVNVGEDRFVRKISLQ